MRATRIAVAIVAVAAWQPLLLRDALTASASVVFELAPWIAAATMLRRALGRRGAWLAYIGCGCADGVSARSLPAALFAAALFGPWVAILRWVAAWCVARVAPTPAACEHGSTLHALSAIASRAVVAGTLSVLARDVALATWPPMAQIAAGAVVGMAGSTCAFGVIASAAALRASSPFAAYAALAVGGIINPFARNAMSPHQGNDRFASGAIAACFAYVAYQRGETLVHPHIALALWACAAGMLIEMKRDHGADMRARALAGLLVAGIVLVPAQPTTFAPTSTTIDDIYGGETIHFEGAYTHNTLVRYAIVCCRADARPIALRLTAALNPAPAWAHVDGIVVRDERGYALRVVRWNAIDPPRDPFLYE